jgi:chemotaxis protein MotA
MLSLIGIVIIFAMVFGGYLGSGGTMEIIFKALPFELTMIGGAAIGAFILGNDLTTIKKTLIDVHQVFKGTKWTKNDYKDTLCLLYELLQLTRQNVSELEQHIERSNESSIFSSYPRISKNSEITEIICDTLRSATLNYDDPNQVEEVIDKRLEIRKNNSLHSSHAAQAVADALPALGIVAAVLGIIKTMGAINEPPEVLGKMIGGALTGTFLGVFLAYGFIGPIASRMRAISEDDQHLLQLIREVLIAHLYSHPPNICVEVGRQNIPSHNRPNFSEVEEALRSIRKRLA